MSDTEQHDDHEEVEKVAEVVVAAAASDGEGEEEKEDFLNELEIEMENRFTQNDDEYVKYLNNEKSCKIPPIIEFERDLYHQTPNEPRKHSYDQQQQQYQEPNEYNHNDQNGKRRRYDDNQQSYNNRY